MIDDDDDIYDMYVCGYNSQSVWSARQALAFAIYSMALPRVRYTRLPSDTPSGTGGCPVIQQDDFTNHFTYILDAYHSFYGKLD